MNDNGLEKWRAGSISEDARAIDAALARIGKTESMTTAAAGGRLFFALDLTPSRDPSLRQGQKRN